MKQNTCSQFLTVAVVAFATGGFSQSANAGWFDSNTGQPVYVAPVGSGQMRSVPEDSASLPGGQNLYWDNVCGTWRDSANGQEVHVAPVGSGQMRSVPEDSASLPGGQNLFWKPCPPPVPPVTATPPVPPVTANTPPVHSGVVGGGWSGAFLGGELMKNSWRNRTTETSALTGAVTNQFSDSGDPLGGGITGGFNFKSGNLVVGPFASIDLLHQTMNHNFGGGTFLGTTARRIVTLGAKAGVETMPGLLVYGIGSVSWLNKDMNINFGGPVTSQNTTVRGFTFGPGIEYQPASWQQAGMPVSVFAQYQHTWWQDAKLNAPVASPLFNYAFKHSDDTIRFGVNVYFP